MQKTSRRGFLRLLGGGAVAAVLAPLAAPAAPTLIPGTIELVELSPSLMGAQIGADVMAGIAEGLAQNGLYTMPGLDHAINTARVLAVADHMGVSPSVVEGWTVAELEERIAHYEELERLLYELPPPTTQQLHERLTEVEGEVSILDTRLDAVEGEHPDLYPGASGAT